MRATKGNENVFVDCGFPPAEAENLRIRAKMMVALTGYIQDRKISQANAARIMGVSQPRISDLVRGKIGLFTIDTLGEHGRRGPERYEVRGSSESSSRIPDSRGRGRIPGDRERSALRESGNSSILFCNLESVL